MLSGAAVFLASLLVWLSLIQPALKSIDYWQAETPKLRAQSQATGAVASRGHHACRAGP